MALSVFRVLNTAGAAVRAFDALTRGPACALGGIELTRLDSPVSVPFGGTQEMAIHKLAGGGRVISLLGGQDRDISLTGKFFGPRAVAKARSIDAIRKAGTKVRLTWADESRSVIIKTFECEYARSGQVLPYRIELVVIPEEQPAQPLSALGRLGKSITDTLGLETLTPTLQAAQGYVDDAKKLLPVLSTISPSLAAKAGGLLNQGAGVLSSTQSVAEGRISAVAGIVSNGVSLGSGLAGLAGTGGKAAVNRGLYDYQTAKELAAASVARAHVEAAARAAADAGAGR